MDFTSLLGDSVSPDVIKQLEEGLAVTIKNALDEREADLTEKANLYADYIKGELSEKAEAYGEYVASEITEKAEAYGEMLHEEFAQKEVQYINRIDEVKQAAEGYAEMIFDDIVEKADAYTESFVQEYKDENTAMFEKIESENTAKDVVESITATLAGFGFDLNQNKTIKQLKESIAEKDSKISELNGKLFEDDVSKQKALVLDEATAHLSLSEKQKVVDAAGDILTESVSGFKNVVKILVSKYDSNDDRVDTTTKKINESVNTNNKQSVSFKGTYTNGQSVSEIASTLI